MLLLSSFVFSIQVWLKQPLVDLAEINVRHDIVETFTSDPTLRESLRDQHLRGERSLFTCALLARFHIYNGMLGFQLQWFECMLCS